MDSSVILNVGGKVYQTKMSTLKRYQNSSFPRLLSADNASSRNEEGHYLLDRDGKVFRHVLNFLRCGRLVLPDGFCEYDLLLCEARFFNLTELQHAIQEETRGAVGLRVGGKTFRMTIKEALKEKDSFFDKMLRGKGVVSRDALGNFLVDRDKSVFPFILRYLRDGGLFTNMTDQELYQLKTEGEYYGLQMLSHHIESIGVMQQLAHEPLQLHLFYRGNGQCAIYANKAKAKGWFKDWNISDICSKQVVFKSDTWNPCRFAGLLDVMKIDNGGIVTLDCIVDFICDKMGLKQKPTGIQLNDDCIKVEFTT